MPKEAFTRITLMVPAGCVVKTTTAASDTGGFEHDYWFDFFRLPRPSRLSESTVSSTGVAKVQIEVPEEKLTEFRESVRKLLEDLT